MEIVQDGVIALSIETSWILTVHIRRIKMCVNTERQNMELNMGERLSLTLCISLKGVYRNIQEEIIRGVAWRKIEVWRLEENRRDRERGIYQVFRK
jgi:hypothetical protein